MRIEDRLFDDFLSFVKKIYPCDSKEEQERIARAMVTEEIKERNAEK